METRSGGPVPARRPMDEHDHSPGGALGQTRPTKKLPDTGAQVSNLRHQFERQLLKSLPGSKIIAAKSPRVWNTVLALMPEADCRTRWVVKLDKLGVAEWTKAAISGAIKETLTAHGLKMPQLAHAVRVLVCGRAQTPSLDAVLELFTRETVQARLRGA